MKQKLISGPVEGYKGMDKKMRCRGFQFEVGKTFELDNDRPLELCANGFHFCPHPSGTRVFYPSGRVFKIVAWDVLDAPPGPGAAAKMVCRKIQIVSEIKTGASGDTGMYNTGGYNTGHRNTGAGNTGNHNTGHWNTGDSNTGNYNAGNRNTGDDNTGDCNAGLYNAGDSNVGDWNTGHWNTGDYNTGNYNAGNRNTGNYNTGHQNAGHWNTGDDNTGKFNTGHQNAGNWNTGDYNTGHRNTGYYNTGNRNTGDDNTGNYNTGDGNTGDRNAGTGNAANRCSGYFCCQSPPLMFFDEPVPDGVEIDDSLVLDLVSRLAGDGPFDCRPFLSLPNATEEKIKKLHKAHIEGRAQRKNL